MTFVNEYISSKDRERYKLEAFEKRFFRINPSLDWAIDRERDIFLRVLNPAARGSEPGDPDARYEKDFHFHRMGYDYLVSTRRLDVQELQSFPGEIFQSDNFRKEGARVLHFYLRHIGEMGRPKKDAQSALSTDRQQVLSDLECALAYGEGGVFASLTKEQTAEPRYAIIKVARYAEVTA
ncbi:hypothetical protein [Rhodoferax sp.]|uniref:hypothetical protein n=1 Tax=Rhodoferax sp. TaxID=50421 RepID=UPI0037832603